MRNKYLLLGAASALMLAACSEDIKGPEANNKPVENALNLTSLSPASQAGRVSLPGETRGLKANRLQLVAKIAPLSDAAAKHWSATGIAIASGNAYVSWHSNHQAAVQATAWGGAVDEISIAALDSKATDGIITNTLTSDGVKFNNVFANGNDLYFPLTCYKSGAVVGKLAIGVQAMDTIRIPGSSANAIEVNGATLTAVTGYKGGAYSLSTGFNADGGSREVTKIVAKDAFGGKYIVDGKILRTDDTHAYITDAANPENEVVLSAPLLSQTKYAEKYDGETGTWSNVGTQAQYYGKHTMAIDNNLIYVGGGLGEAGKNGLRVYSEGSGEPVWENGTGTTAVCVDGDYVYAATDAGLRVYGKYNGTELPLYAFEVLNYDENGNAADAPGENKPVAGTDAHSPNFVAVGGGYIFVACGQSGVYVFKLNENATGNTKPAGFVTIVDGVRTNFTDDVEEGDSQKFEIPAAPENDKEFLYWLADNGNKYTPGQDPVTLEAGTIRELTPIYNEPTGFKVENGVDATEKIETGKQKEFVVPAALESVEPGKTFVNWTGDDGKSYEPNQKVTLDAGTVIVLTPNTADKNTAETGFKSPNGNDIKQVPEGEKGTFIVPAGPEVDDQEFDYWSGDDGKNYNPGETELNSGEVVTLTPVYKVFDITVTFHPDYAEGTVPEPVKSGVKKTLTIPNMPGQGGLIMPVGQKEFKGWCIDVAEDQGPLSDLYEPGKSYTFTESVTLYPVWSTTVIGGAGEGSDGSEI